MYYVWNHWDCFTGSHCRLGVVDKDTPPEDIEGNGHCVNEVNYFKDCESAMKFVKKYYSGDFLDTVDDKIYLYDKNLTDEKDLEYLSKELETSVDIIKIIQGIDKYRLEYDNDVEDITIKCDGKDYNVKVDHRSHLFATYQMAVAIQSQRAIEKEL